MKGRSRTFKGNTTPARAGFGAPALRPGSVRGEAADASSEPACEMPLAPQGQHDTHEEATMPPFDSAPDDTNAANALPRRDLTSPPPARFGAPQPSPAVANATALFGNASLARALEHAAREEEHHEGRQPCDCCAAAAAENRVCPDCGGSGFTAKPVVCPEHILRMLKGGSGYIGDAVSETWLAIWALDRFSFPLSDAGRAALELIKGPVAVALGGAQEAFDTLEREAWATVAEWPSRVDGWPATEIEQGHMVHGTTCPPNRFENGPWRGKDLAKHRARRLENPPAIERLPDSHVTFTDAWASVVIDACEKHGHLEPMPEEVTALAEEAAIALGAATKAVARLVVAASHFEFRFEGMPRTEDRRGRLLRLLEGSRGAGMWLASETALELLSELRERPAGD